MIFHIFNKKIQIFTWLWDPHLWLCAWNMKDRKIRTAVVCRAHHVCLSQITSLSFIYLCSCHQSYPTTCIPLKKMCTHTGEHLCNTAIIPTISILWFPFNTPEIVQHKHLEINTYHVYRDIRLFSLWNLCTCACLCPQSSYCLRLHRSPCTTNTQS